MKKGGTFNKRSIHRRKLIKLRFYEVIEKMIQLAQQLLSVFLLVNV